MTAYKEKDNENQVLNSIDNYHYCDASGFRVRCKSN
jgi:hypothetical protein